MTATSQKHSGKETAKQDYVPIKDYALIGNCHSAALISKGGSIDWYCPDRFDAPAVFCRILDSQQGGFFAVEPRADHSTSRRYVEDTNILQTDHRAGDATLTVLDFMPIEQNTQQKFKAHPRGGSRIVRRLTVDGGEIDVRLRFRPTAEYGQQQPEFTDLPGRGVVAHAGDHVAGLGVWGADFQVADGNLWEADIHLKPGQTCWVVAVHGADEAETRSLLDIPEDDDDLDATREFWDRWADRCTYKGPYRKQVMRSALALKLLTYDPTGAVVASPTTSLPEDLGGERNWDYRYTWMRDSALILYSLITIGYDQEAVAFLQWIRNVLQGNAVNDPQIMYTIDGGKDIPERELTYLDGYCGSKPVRIGNAASKQLQLDIYGELMTAAYIHFHRSPDQPHTPGAGSATLEEPTWRVLRSLVDDAVRLWPEKDNGIWEVRGGKQDFLYSKLMCWAAIDRGLRLAQEHKLPADVDAWEKARHDLREAIEQKGYHQDVHAFTQAFGSDALDASALQIPRVGFLPATDPRVLSTIDAIRDHLSQDGFIYRYLTQDGLTGGEGTFLLCSFWMVDALGLAGRTDEATKLFEHLLSLANDVGLYSEELDATNGTFLGNFPQGFTHLSLVRAAVDLARARVHGAEQEPHTEAHRAHQAHHAAASGK